MSQGGKSEDLNLGEKTEVPVLKTQGCTEDFTNSFTKDGSSSISRLEYNEGISSMKSQMSDMTNMLRVLMSRLSPTDTTNIIPNNPRLGERDVISHAHDDGSSAIPP